MNRRADIVGAILAGGGSSRMGADKATMPVNGIPMITHVAGTLSQVFAEVIVLAGREARYPFLGLKHISDIFEECGPLGGIHAALVHASPNSVFILACDMPFVPPALIDFMVSHKSQVEAKVASIGGKVQPLCGLYDSECRETMESRLQKGKNSVLGALEEIEHSVISIGPNLPFYFPHILGNVNDSQDYQVTQKRAAGEEAK
jgi:molybdopterin-guanine dinucleotide biosynthesis protein A